MTTSAWLSVIVVANVLRFGVIFVAFDARSALARIRERNLPAALGAHRKHGNHPLELLARALGTRGNRPSQHQQLKMMTAAATVVFVNRHGAPLWFGINGSAGRAGPKGLRYLRARQA